MDFHTRELQVFLQGQSLMSALAFQDQLAPRTRLLWPQAQIQAPGREGMASGHQPNLPIGIAG